MGFISVGHSALGAHHQSCPLFDHGCHFYWDARFGNLVGQERGAAQIAAAGLYESYVGTDPYYIWEPGREQYIEIDPTVLPVWPYDGNLYPARTNYFNKSDPVSGIRGPFTAEAGLTLDAIALPSKHIVIPIGAAAADLARIRNTTGATKRMYRQETSSATLNRLFSILVKRSDGATVTSADLEIGFASIADPLGANISTSVEGTVYRKISSDGWYLVSNYVQNIALAPDIYYYADIKNGAHLYYEMPQIEAFGASIKEPTQRIATTAAITATVREAFDLSFNSSLGHNLPACGWMGISFVPQSSADDPNSDYPASYIVRWAGAATGNTQYHQMYISNTLQQLAYSVMAGGTSSEAFLQLTSSEVQQGVPMGMVATWGWRGGTPQFVMCANGVFKEIDVTGTMPADLTGSNIFIGSDNAYTDPPNISLFNVGLGTKMLSRYDCMNLSQWFYRRALERNTWGIAGA